MLYKARARIEQGFGRLKRFKRVALRCEKTARNFRSIVAPSPGAAPLDIDDLVARRILVKDASGGRSTSYSLKRDAVA
ncbi:transposase [Methylocella tundrae]|uniref:transposase n=1 Tax=Methylocella tundrae TaxID=227605 RepID=UPI003CC7DD81